MPDIRRMPDETILDMAARFYDLYAASAGKAREAFVQAVSNDLDERVAKEARRIANGLILAAWTS